MELYEQLNIFDISVPTFYIDKPIRLIELFAGIGSQAMALRDLGADFEHYRISEWEVNANRSYKAIHNSSCNMDYSKKFEKFKWLTRILYEYGLSVDGKTHLTLKEIRNRGENWCRQTYNDLRANHNIGSIVNAHALDLKIVDTDKYCYMMTYSFPCQDLSLAGKQKGMKKGSGTRSGLLWEVERLLNECSELPQVLLMENVPQVHSKANMPDFQKWIDFLSSKGYSNYWQDLNAKDYGVAQNRNRCFMVSLLGEWNYKFPKSIPLERKLKDYLEDEVDEKYYINTEKAQELIQTLIQNGTLKQGTGYANYNHFEQYSDIARCIQARDYKGFGGSAQTQNAVIEQTKPIIVGNVNPSGNGINGNVYVGNLCPTITTNKGEGAKICVDLSLNSPAKKDISNCITANEDRGISNQQSVGNGVVEWKERRLGNIYGFDGGNYAGNIYDREALSPTIRTYQGGQPAANDSCNAWQESR